MVSNKSEAEKYFAFENKKRKYQGLVMFILLTFIPAVAFLLVFGLILEVIIFILGVWAIEKGKWK